MPAVLFLEWCAQSSSGSYAGCFTPASASSGNQDPCAIWMAPGSKGQVPNSLIPCIYGTFYQLRIFKRALSILLYKNNKLDSVDGTLYYLSILIFKFDGYKRFPRANKCNATHRLLQAKEVHSNSVEFESGLQIQCCIGQVYVLVLALSNSVPLGKLIPKPQFPIEVPTWQSEFLIWSPSGILQCFLAFYQQLRIQLRIQLLFLLPRLPFTFCSPGSKMG